MKYLLVILLVVIILLGVLTLGSEDVGSTNIGDKAFIEVPVEPVFVEPQVLGTKKGCPYYELIAQYEWNTDVACAVMKYESRYDPEAHFFSHRTKDNSYGLFQINLYGNLANERPSAEWLLVPENNVQYAYELWKKHGWRPWGVCHPPNQRVTCWL